MVQKLNRQFAEYCQRYDHIRITRTDGIIELALHTEGRSLEWSSMVHEELAHCFIDLNLDPDNKVVIITGVGDNFCDALDLVSYEGHFAPKTWPALFHETQFLVNTLMDVEIPVVGAVNGPASVHAEIPILSDIVIAADTAFFQDKGHFVQDVVPGDSVHVVWPTLIGQNRGRYFLLTGQKIGAQQAMDLGVVSEVVPALKLRERTWELARQLALRSDAVRRYTRYVLTNEWRRLFQSNLGIGVATEGSALLAQLPRSVD
jgi:enoyl-CoA hydratase/carnithine racemase